MTDEEDEFEVEFDLGEDERFYIYTDDYRDMLTEYVKRIYDADMCPHCLAILFDEFVDEVLE